MELLVTWRTNFQRDNNAFNLCVFLRCSSEKAFKNNQQLKLMDARGEQSDFSRECVCAQVRICSASWHTKNGLCQGNYQIGGPFSTSRAALIAPPDFIIVIAPPLPPPHAKRQFGCLFRGARVGNFPSGEIRDGILGVRRKWQMRSLPCITESPRSSEASMPIPARCLRVWDKRSLTRDLACNNGREKNAMSAEINHSIFYNQGSHT